MGIDIVNNIPTLKTQNPSSHVKPTVKKVQVPAPHKNEEIARKAEEVKHEVMSIKKVEMSYDSDINRVIITVVDSANGKVVQQIPGPDSITFMRRFQQNLKETLNIKV